MAINGVGSSKVINIYNSSSKNVTNKIKVSQSSDSLEISNLGRSLSAYSLDNNFDPSKEKIEKIKSQIDNGTYNVNAKLVAQKIYENMQGKGV